MPLSQTLADYWDVVAAIRADVEELRAELKRERARRQPLIDRCDQLTRERDEARQRARKAEVEVARLRGELEAMRRGWVD